MDIKQIEKEVITAFENNNYMPLGADGGCLKYVSVSIPYFKDSKDLGCVRASITLDHEISNIRKIWELGVYDKNDNLIDIYNFTKAYYSLR